MNRTIIVVSAVALAASLALAGCTAATTSTGETTGTPTAVATPTPTSTDSATEFAPKYSSKGTAAENLAYFNLVGHSLLDKHPNTEGKPIVDYFVAHGFDKSEMEVTPDKTSIGLQAWNIEFSVNMNGTCLIGQAGNVGFQSFVAPLTAQKKCLIGTTRKIDW